MPEYKGKLVEVEMSEDEEELFTEAIYEDWENVRIDEYGVKYSADRKRLLSASKNLRAYSIKRGTKVICNNAIWHLEKLT